jgi:hypothetical protein
MRSTILGKFFALVVLTGVLSPVLEAEDRRSIPLDMYLIIDNSAALRNSKNDTVSWINANVVDRILMEGDRITVWAAGDRAQIIYSDTISGFDGKKEIKDKLLTLDASGSSADFSGALTDVQSRLSQTTGGRLPYTMLITGSAEGLEPALAANSQGLLRWFRSERYERWQVLIVAPDIGRRVRQAAAAFMNSR